MKKIILIFILLTHYLLSIAQDYPKKDIDLQQFIESLFATQDEDVNYEDFYESLFQLYTNPLNLNKATREDLQSLYILSPTQINAFLDYRAKNGELLNIYELQAIPGFDQYTIDQLINFAYVSDKGLTTDNRPLLQRIIEEENNYFFVRYQRTLENESNFFSNDGTPPKFVGSPNKVYGRFRTSHTKDFSIGFTFEKDAGEQIIWDPSTNRYGMDFWSFHFALQEKGKLKSFVIGDYQVQFGQGLLSGAGFIVGKGSETITTIRRSNLGVRPYTSVLEYNFFRGAAFTYELGPIELTGFYSYNESDGILRNDTIESDAFITSIQQTGFHRTTNEVNAKGDIAKHDGGVNLLYTTKNEKFHIGVTALYTRFNTKIDPKPNNYNQFYFRGIENYNTGIFFNYNWYNFNIFGEAARSKSGGIGAVGGIIANLSKSLEMSMLFRNYDKDFHSFYGTAFAEKSTNQNEQGIYWGVKYKPNRKFFITAYYDWFRFPWLSYRINMPSQGYEYLGRVNFKPSKKILLYAQMREEVKNRNVSIEDKPLDLVAEGKKRNYLFNLDYKTDGVIWLKSRIQMSTYNLAGQITQGYAIIQDLNLDFGKLRFNTRMALFDTDDFNNAQYTYEKDVLYAFSLPAYNGTGIRNYLMIVYKPVSKLNFWFRIARTTFTNQKNIDTVNGTITGNSRTEVKFQVKISL